MVKLAVVCLAALMGVVFSNSELEVWTAAKELWTSAKEGNMTYVNKYLAKGANLTWPYPNGYDIEHGYTAIHIASKFNHPDVINRLLDVGVDINLITTNSNYYHAHKTALVIASEYNSTNAAKTLIARDADVNQVYGDGEPPLLYATRERNLDVVNELITHGANVNLGNKFSTPLTMASYHGYLDIVNALIAHGANVNLGEENDGDTPLIDASRNGNIDIVNVLISHGANVNIMSNNESVYGSPLMAATCNNETTVTEILLQNGADPHKLNENGTTAAEIAREKGYIQLANIIENYTSITTEATLPTAAPNSKRAPRSIRLLQLLKMQYDTGDW